MTKDGRTQPGAAKGVVIACSAPGSEPLYAHEREAIAAVSRAIAEVKGFLFQDGAEDGARNGGCLYFVPDDSLLAGDADRLGIKGPQDFFGGVVPWRFAMTKAITHEVVDTFAERPQGWSARFGRRVRPAVLAGYTAFSRHDAVRAAECLLRRGSVRLKPPLSSRGRDQQTIGSAADVEDFLERYSSSDLEECGLVLEADLGEPATLSVGTATVDEIAIAYYGAQRMTTDNAGQPVYGGSDLVVVRGGWSALEKIDLPRALSIAVAQAKLYDEAMVSYPGFFASRRNYDIGQGKDSSGVWRSGVLEASWRIGGSSTAELAAIRAMKQDPDVQLVRASTVKKFGNACGPAGADVHFQGDDPDEGLITRYTIVTQTVRSPAPAARGAARRTAHLVRL